MDESRRRQIYENLRWRETEDLLQIWQEANLDEWEEETFEILAAILHERLGSIPAQPAPDQAHSISSDTTSPEITAERSASLPRAVYINRLLGKARDLLLEGEHHQALEVCEQIIQFAPDQATGFYQRGWVYDELDETVNALRDYQKAVNLDPEMREAWEGLLSIEPELEEAYLVSASKQHLDRALEYWFDENPQRALEECELAREGLPRIARAYNDLGMMLEELGRMEPAIDTYLEAIRLNPRYLPARENLANARIRFEEQLYWKDLEGDREIGFEFNLQAEEAIDLGLSEYRDPVPGWVYMDEKAFLLPGWPGHRNRPGRSGYDPLETSFEEAHLEGVMIRLLFTGKLRTHNLLNLLVMGFLGMLLCLPLVFIFGGIGSSTSLLVIPVIFVVASPYWVIGMALLINILFSLTSDRPVEFEENGYDFF